MKRIAVFRGGTGLGAGAYYKDSAPVVANLATLEYPYRDVAVTTTGELLLGGRKLTIERALEGVDLVLLVLPPECEKRAQIERYLVASNLPCFGKRTALSSIINHRHYFPKTTCSVPVREVQVVSLPHFRNQPQYLFPALESISDRRAAYRVSDWIDTAAKTQIAAKLAAVLKDLPASTPLVQSTFDVFGRDAQLTSISVAPELLYSPVVAAARDSVGFRSEDFLQHIVESIT